MATAEYERVLAAVVDGGAVNRHIIAEQTGIEPQAISNHLSYLKGKGLVEKVNGMWSATDGAAAVASTTPNVTVHTQAEAAPTPPPTRKPQVKRAKAVKAAGPAPGALEKLAKTAGRKKAVGRRPKAAPARATKARRAPRPKAPAIAAPTGPRSCDFAIAESGEVLFRVTGGKRAGEMGSIERADAIALYRLMHACEFIREAA